MQMAQYAPMVRRSSEYGEFWPYPSAEEYEAEASGACRRKIEVRPMGGE
jgi:hypothetical protein